MLNSKWIQECGKRDRPKECYNIPIMLIGAFELKGNFTDSTVWNNKKSSDLNIFWTQTSTYVIRLIFDNKCSGF